MNKSLYLLLLDNMEEDGFLDTLIKEHMKKQTKRDVCMITGGTFRKPMREPGRNEKCPCGSGKKFKNCCLTPGYEPIRQQVINASRVNETRKR